MKGEFRENAISGDKYRTRGMEETCQKQRPRIKTGKADDDERSSGADPGRNLTRAQQKARGRGYMGVENISEL